MIDWLIDNDGDGARVIQVCQVLRDLQAHQEPLVDRKNKYIADRRVTAVIEGWKEIQGWWVFLGSKDIPWVVYMHMEILRVANKSDDIKLVRRPLRSSTDRTLTVPRTHNRFGDSSFAVAGPRFGNSLLISLRQISSYGQFRRYLKNHLFGIWKITAQCNAWFSVLYKYSYLLTYLRYSSVSFKTSILCAHCMYFMFYSCTNDSRQRHEVFWSSLCLSVHLLSVG